MTMTETDTTSPWTATIRTRPYTPEPPSSATASTTTASAGVDEDVDPIDGIDNNLNGVADDGYGSCIFAQSGPAQRVQDGRPQGVRVGCPQLRAARAGGARVLPRDPRHRHELQRRERQRL